MSSRQSVGELPRLRVVLADAVEQGPRGVRRGERVRVTVLARERLAGLLGGGAQGVGEAQPGLVGLQGDVLPRLRRHRLDLAQPEAEQVCLLRPLAGGRDHLLQLGLRRLEPAVQVGVRREQRGQRLAPEPVERLALGAGLQQPVLVGLAVHGHQGLGDLREGGHRHRGTADERPGPALGRHVAGQHDQVVLDLAADLLDGVGEPGQSVDTHDALDPGGLRAGPHRAGVGATAQQQPERGHDHGLARSGLTGDHRQARAEPERGRLDHPERGDPDLLKHRTPPRAAAVARSSRASPRPAGRTSRPAGR